MSDRAARNVEALGRYAHAIGTFFQGRGDDGRKGFMAIDRVVAWSRTERGGRQLPLLAPVPEGGCMQYGLCEPPGADDECPRCGAAICGCEPDVPDDGGAT